MSALLTVMLSVPLPVLAVHAENVSGDSGGAKAVRGVYVNRPDMRPEDEQAEDIRRAVQEADSLYARFVAILNNVDIPERFEAVEDILAELWEEYVFLDERYPEVDPVLIDEALFQDEEFLRLSEEFDQQMERMREELPGQAARLDEIMDDVAERKFQVDIEVAVEKATNVFEELVQTLEGIETYRDAQNTFDDVRALAAQLRQIESSDDYFRDELRERMAESDYAVSLARRFDEVLARFEEDSRMGIVFDALDVLIEEDTSAAMPDQEQEAALAEYGEMLERTIDLFSKLKTPDDVDRYAADLRSLAQKEMELREKLPGSVGEELIESDPELVELLQRLGEQQMRLMNNAEIAQRMSKLFSRE